MNVLSILFFAGGVVVLILAVTQVLARGWGPLDVSVFDVYFVVLPRYLLLISVALLIAGSFRLLPRISDISKRRSETRITDVTHKIRWDAKAGLWTGCYTFRQRRKRCARVFGGHAALPDRAGSRDAFAGDQPDRPLSNLGHELIVPHAGNVRLIGDGSAYSIPSRPVLSPTFDGVEGTDGKTATTASTHSFYSLLSSRKFFNNRSRAFRYVARCSHPAKVPTTLLIRSAFPWMFPLRSLSGFDAEVSERALQLFSPPLPEG